MKREYGIDLLKIVAMLLIVAEHIVEWGGYGLSACQPGVKGGVLAIVNAFCLLAVNCFVLASGWVMCRKDFKAGRIVKLWCEVEFYCLLVLVVTTVCFPSITISKRDWIFTLLPLTMNRYWFFTQYVGLFFLMPVLNAAINNLSRRTLVTVLIAGFALFSFHPFFLKNDMMHVYRGYCVFWFAYLYLLAGTLSVHRVLDKVPTWMTGFGVLVGGVGSYLALLGSIWLSPKMGMTVNPGLFDAYNSPFLLIGSVSMLLLFARMNLTAAWLQKAIAFIAPGVFSVYVIHSHHYFRVMTNWNETWTKFLSTHNLTVCLVTILIASLAIFFGCVLIDDMRRRVKKLIFRK